MIVKYVGDFKVRRSGLPLELQIRVDELVIHAQHTASYLCELPASIQHVVFNLDDTTRLRSVLFNKNKARTLHILLENRPRPA